LNHFTFPSANYVGSSLFTSSLTRGMSIFVVIVILVGVAQFTLLFNVCFLPFYLNLLFPTCVFTWWARTSDTSIYINSHWWSMLSRQLVKTQYWCRFKD
jgi:hypothetical protein